MARRCCWECREVGRSGGSMFPPVGDFTMELVDDDLWKSFVNEPMKPFRCLPGADGAAKAGFTRDEGWVISECTIIAGRLPDGDGNMGLEAQNIEEDEVEEVDEEAVVERV